MTSFTTNQTSEWKSLSDTSYQYNPKLAVSQTAQVFIARHKYQKSSLFAVKFYRQGEQATELVSSLRGHKMVHIVSIVEVSDKTQPFIMMELCKQNLREQMLWNQSPVSASQTLKVAEQILKGLKELRCQTIIHADIKPENVVISEDGTIKLCDLDFSMSSSQARKNKVRIGTLPYMAPQILKDGKCSYKSDIWSLGVVLYELYFKQFPWERHKPEKYLTEQFCFQYHNTIEKELVNIRHKINALKMKSKKKNEITLMEIILACLQFQRENRKTLEELTTILRHQPKRIPLVDITQYQNQQQTNNQSFSESTHQLKKTFEQLTLILDSLPPADLLTKKINNLYQIIKKSQLYLKQGNEHALKQALSIFASEGNKVSEIIRNNLKRLGHDKRSVVNEQKIKLAEQLQTANDYLETLGVYSRSYSPKKSILSPKKVSSSSTEEEPYSP